MATSLAALVTQPPSGRSRALLIDAHDYAQVVLLQGKPVPWHEPMAYSNFFGQAQALLRPDVALLDLDRFVAQALDLDASLRGAMAAKSRTGFALRTLLADASLAERAVALATVFAKTQREPVVVQIPSPMQWLARTHGISGASLSASASVAALDADDAENASMYVADWLRAFAALPLAGVLLDDRMPGAGGAAAGGSASREPGGLTTVRVPLSAYTPIANVADHYGWTLGLRGDDGVELRGGEVGAIIRTPFWAGDAGDADLGDGDFLVGEIPALAVPEAVLSRIATLV
ncbi:hypothetical protein BH09ACT6_BH09ACT6_23800 [soil metagenome]